MPAISRGRLFIFDRGERPRPSALLEQRDRRAAVELRISHRLPGPVRLQRRPALLSRRGRRPRLHLRRRGHAALPPGRGRQAASGRSTPSPTSTSCRTSSASAARRSSRATCLSCRSAAVPRTTPPHGPRPASEATAAASSPSTSTPARSAIAPPTSWPATPARCWPPSAAAAGASSSRAAGWSASTRPPARSISIFPGGRRSGERQRQQPGRRRRPGFHLRDLRPRQRLAGGQARRTQGGLDATRTRAPRKEHAVSLEHADPRRGLPVRLQRPAYGERRAALHRTGHRQSHVARARSDAHFALAGG